MATQLKKKQLQELLIEQEQELKRAKHEVEHFKWLNHSGLVSFWNTKIIEIKEKMQELKFQLALLDKTPDWEKSQPGSGGQPEAHQ